MALKDAAQAADSGVASQDDLATAIEIVPAGDAGHLLDDEEPHVLAVLLVLDLTRDVVEVADTRVVADPHMAQISERVEKPHVCGVAEPEGPASDHERWRQDDVLADVIPQLAQCPQLELAVRQ